MPWQQRREPCRHAQLAARLTLARVGLVVNAHREVVKAADCDPQNRLEVGRRPLRHGDGQETNNPVLGRQRIPVELGESTS